ncbi:NAD(P)/FAD-dependent oxidoreductase [Oceanobacillus sp. J11TS1]|uniref:NAD(P)/FAD-dependent oxidoreductase n=1 Tax=Oceanobacillus sp. J11TS1 TaxID=2807191 RepID=UPI001B02EC2E|nr:NAD(P)/FAD-dependent oxidoreductase [Oceanobacillus sp. J11TS1]GIO23636.1 ferredoxin--NADP reductase 2 [Oceanobacillus sp. J11TS1]
MEKEMYDVTIIGGGPIGLFAAFYGGMRQLKVKIIESLPQLGGQLTALYPEKYIYDVAGFPKVKAQDMVDQLVIQAEQFNPTVVLNQTVENLVKVNDEYFQIVSDKEIHYSKTVLITAGNGAFKPRKLNHENAKMYEGKNLHYFINDLEYFAKKEICILGGGDSAVDWALMMEPIAKKVNIIHRRDKFRAHEASVKNMEDSAINVFTTCNIVDINGNEDRIHSISIKKDNDEIVQLELDELITNYGFVSSLGPIKEWGLEFSKNSIVVDSKMRTNIEGVYSAGDIVTFDGKVKLIATGFSDAATAISSIKTYVDPKSRQQPQHSTTLFEKIKI